jgi:arylsulfatase A-like enzyme
VRPDIIGRWLRFGAAHLLVAGLTGALFGAFDGARYSVDPWTQGVAISFFGAGLAGAAAACLGLVQALGVALGLMLWNRTPWASDWKRAFTPEGASQSQAMVLVHAIVTAGALGLLACYLLVQRFLVASREIKDPDVLFDVTVLMVAGALGLMFVATAVGPRLLMQPVSWLDRRFGLPFPPWRGLRYALFVLLPAYGVLMPLFFEHGSKLGVLGYAFGTVLFLVSEGMIYILWCAWVRLLRGKRWAVLTSANAVALLLLAAAITAEVTLRTNPHARSIIGVQPLLGAATSGLRGATDVDGDGISSLYGGGDCAPLDAARSPATLDIPDNRVDEDCDGDDATRQGVLTPLRTYHGAGQLEAKAKYNVLWVIVDSLRADHLGSYGYEKNTSPALDDLGRRAWTFTRAFSQSSTTALSMPSMLGGRRPGTIEWRATKVHPQLGDSERTLGELLVERGYQTTLIMNAWLHRRLKTLSRGFEDVRVSPASLNWQSAGAATRSTFLAMDAAQDAGKPFYIVVHYDDVHHPYMPHEGHAVPSFDEKKPSRDGAEPPGQEELRESLTKYDQGIAYWDTAFSLILDTLAASDLWENTIIIVTSDHGEEFGEHGGDIHSRSCYQEVVHVPLIMRVPGESPRRIGQRVALVDIVPTLVELLDLDGEGLQLDGQSLLVPILAPKMVDRERPIFCSIYQLMRGRKNFFTRSVRDDRNTLVHDALSNRIEFFDNQQDPGQQKDLSREPAHQEEIERMKRQLGASLKGNLFEVRRFK